MLRVGSLLDDMVVLVQFFEKTLSRFLKWLHQFPAPPTVHEGPFSSRPRLHALPRAFLMTATLTGVRGHLVGVPCSSLRTGDVERRFTCLLEVCVSPLERCLFRSSAQFLIETYFLDIE